MNVLVKYIFKHEGDEEYTEYRAIFETIEDADLFIEQKFKNDQCYDARCYNFPEGSPLESMDSMDELHKKYINKKKSGKKRGN